MIKLIASNLENTLLNDENKFDEQLFQKQLNQMNEQGIHFAIISKNSYPHLLTQFQNVNGPIDFISENGAQIVNNGVIIQDNPIELNDWRKLLDWMQNESSFKNVLVTLSGKMNAYTPLNDGNDSYLKQLKQDYNAIQSVRHLNMIGDQIYQVRLDFKESNVYLQQQLIDHEFGDRLKAVVDGNHTIYVSNANVSRADALDKLADYNEIRSRQIVTFGNSLNDYDLLNKYQNSYAVSHSAPELKSVANVLKDENNAVLNQIQLILNSNNKGTV